MTDRNILVGKNLTRRFQRGKREVILAINDSDIDVEKGKVTMIMGASGSGKSTLLNVLSGLDKPTEGRVLFDDQNIVEWTEDMLATWRRTTVGFVFQTFELIPQLTAIENVMLPLIPAKAKTQDIRVEALSLLKQVGIFDTTHERSVKLSGGEQQRVSIARALIAKPKIIFADEPTGSLDEDTGRKVLDLIKRQTRGHDRAVVLVSHNPDLKRYADHLYQMRQGKLTKEK
ncbi:MAG: ABC transporter ATP-binding protein [Candidatus Hodarchaeales archaeon]|jgi:ABC-type lipoprotein export system ATPase subunit